MHADGYFSLVLTDDSSARLLRAFATLRRPLAHHCTVKYGSCNPDDLPPAFSAADLGQPFTLAVVGSRTREDGGIQAVVVSLLLPDGRVAKEAFSENAVPHITVATDGVTEPSEANALLAGGFEPCNGLTLTATLAHTRSS